MSGFSRYALYFAPEPGALADFGAAWLGWDLTKGTAAAHPPVTGLSRPLSEITKTPRKYGLHATIKPPFALAQGQDSDALLNAADAFCSAQSPITLPGLKLTRLGGFLALCVDGDTAALTQMAADSVAALDRFRAPPSQAELDRRRAKSLSPRQEAMLVKWGYPYVMADFRFHITLTGHLPAAEAKQTAEILAPIITPLLPKPFVIRDLCLAGEGQDGRFTLIRRLPFLGRR